MELESEAAYYLSVWRKKQLFIADQNEILYTIWIQKKFKRYKSVKKLILCNHSF